MSNAHVFRSLSRHEDAMLRAAMPRTAAREEQAKPAPQRLVAPLTVKLSSLCRLEAA